MTRTWLAAGLLAVAGVGPAGAVEITVEMHAVTAEGVGESIGTITVRDSDQGGSVFIADLRDLSPGPHGFHIHENGSCEPAENDQGEMTAALSAGGHWDPENTGMHRGPNGRGHKGDLPAIQVLVDEDGALPVRRVQYAPHVAADEISGLALIIHENGDNYRDEPKPLGGGGARVACGVIP